MEIDDVLEFWFDGVDDEKTIAEAPSARRWFGGGSLFDQELSARFTSLAERAAAGQCESWQVSANGSLALVLVLDQFSRNIWRNTPRAFAQDPLARAACARAIATRLDDELPLLRRSFLYMPLMHAEDLAAHTEALAKFGELVDLARTRCPHNATYFESTLDYERRHRAIIERFGRYPHRNAILARRSTPEEEAFLKEPGSAF